MFRTTMITLYVATVFVALTCSAAFAMSPIGGAAQATSTAAKPAVEIMFTSKPNPPKTGSNAFEVMVKDSAGKPITDADVSAMFYMAAMPAMKMPEMRNTIALKHQKDGTYTGNGQVMMAGKWDVTVIVKRAGKEIGSKKFPVTAQ